MKIDDYYCFILNKCFIILRIHLALIASDNYYGSTTYFVLLALLAFLVSILGVGHIHPT